MTPLQGFDGKFMLSEEYHLNFLSEEESINSIDPESKYSWDWQKVSGLVVDDFNSSGEQIL